MVMELRSLLVLVMVKEFQGFAHKLVFFLVSNAHKLVDSTFMFIYEHHVMYSQKEVFIVTLFFFFFFFLNCEKDIFINQMYKLQTVKGTRAKGASQRESNIRTRLTPYPSTIICHSSPVEATKQPQKEPYVYTSPDQKHVHATRKNHRTD